MKIKKTSETTPTMASIVDDYSTSTQDGYSCNYVNKDNTYSTTEVKTNKMWIDGKPIYRLVITGSDSFQFNPSTPSEIDTLTHCEVYVKDSTSVIPIPAIGVSYSTGNHFIGWSYYNNSASWNANHLYIVKEQGQFSDYQNYYAIMEYTKTTD